MVPGMVFLPGFLYARLSLFLVHYSPSVGDISVKTHFAGAHLPPWHSARSIPECHSPCLVGAGFFEC